MSRLKRPCILAHPATPLWSSTSLTVCQIAVQVLCSRIALLFGLRQHPSYPTWASPLRSATSDRPSTSSEPAPTLQRMLSASSNSTESSKSGPTLQRTVTQRSSVWEHFTQPKDKKSSCKHCHRKYTYTGGYQLAQSLEVNASVCSSGTAAVIYQDRRSYCLWHETYWQLWVSYSQKKLKCTVAKSPQISELVLNWVTGDKRQLTIVADRGFRELVRLLEPVMICSDI